MKPGDRVRIDYSKDITGLICFKDLIYVIEKSNDPYLNVIVEYKSGAGKQSYPFYPFELILVPGFKLKRKVIK